MNNLKIGPKLIISFIVIAIFASLSGVLSVITMTKSNADYDAALHNYGFSQGDISKAALSITRAQAAVADIVGFTHQDDIDFQMSELERNLKSFNDTYFPLVKAALSSPEEEAKFAEIEEQYKNWIVIKDKVVAMGQTTDAAKIAEAQHIMIDELYPVFELFYYDFIDLLDLKVNSGDAISDDLIHEGETMSLISNIAIAVSIALSILLGIFISRGISGPIKQCTKRLKLLSQGDLKSPVPEIKSNDENGKLAKYTQIITEALSKIIFDFDSCLGEVADGNFTKESNYPEIYIGDFAPMLASYNKITSGLSDTLTQINTASQQVDAGADQVADGASNLSQSSTEQAASVQELHATIGDVSEKITQTSKDAAHAKKATDDTIEALELGTKQMKEMTDSMDEINKKSQEISKIIKAIDDIAFQTNILSLNAAVEAARAGEAGKGFAVVADEVRNLATKSAESAKSTAMLIEETVAAVEQGNMMATSTADSLSKISGLSAQVSTLVDNISKAAEGEAEAVAQINSGIEQIASVTQTNSATAEESAAAAEELSGQSRLLGDLIANFNLK